MKLFVSKKYLFVILLIVVLLKPCSCYADAKDYVFQFDADLADKLCYEPNNNAGCVVTCKDNSKAKNEGEMKLYGGAGLLLSDDCNGADNIATFYVRDTGLSQSFDSDANFKTFLSTSVCGGTTSCYGYVKEKYCKNFSSSDSLCKKLKALDGKSSEGTGKNGEKVQACYASIIPMSGDDLLNSKLKFGIQMFLNTYSSGKQSLLIESVTKGDGDSSVGATYYDSEHMVNVGENNKFYFFAKGSDYSTFEKDYAKVFKEGVCPNITFCLNTFDKKDWYAELGGTCDPLKYETGVSETTSDGSNSGLKLRETEPTPGKNLINGEILIGGCKALLGGDDGDSTLVDLLKTILTVVKIVVPIILIVMGSLDFARAIFSANEDEIKKSQSKFIRRLIVGVIIFLAPSILQGILTLAHSVWDVIDPTLCGILD